MNALACIFNDVLLGRASDPPEFSLFAKSVVCAFSRTRRYVVWTWDLDTKGIRGISKWTPVGHRSCWQSCTDGEADAVGGAGAVSGAPGSTRGGSSLSSGMPPS
jgi:hypothetical protein